MDPGGIVCYQTDRRTRFAEISRSFFELAAGVPLAMLLGAAIGFALSLLGLNIWLCCGLGFAAMLLLIRFMSREAVNRLRFRVVFHTDRLELGGGITRLNAPYEEVEMFGYTKEAESNCLGLLWRGHNAVIYLPMDYFVASLQLLQTRCVNAIYVDHSGREHLPPNPTRPDLTIAALWRHCRRVARAAFGACAGAIILALYSAAGMGACVTGKAPWEQVLHYAGLFVGSVVAGVSAWLTYRCYSRRAQSIAGELLKLRN